VFDEKGFRIGRLVAARAQVFEGQKQAAPEHRACCAATSDREDESLGRPWLAVSPPMLDQRRQAFLRNFLGQRRVARSENAIAEQSPGQIPHSGFQVHADRVPGGTVRSHMFQIMWSELCEHCFGRLDDGACPRGRADIRRTRHMTMMVQR